MCVDGAEFAQDLTERWRGQGPGAEAGAGPLPLPMPTSKPRALG